MVMDMVLFTIPEFNFRVLKEQFRNCLTQTGRKGINYNIMRPVHVSQFKNFLGQGML